MSIKVPPHKEVIKFWFDSNRAGSWFRKDSEFDQEITQRFADTLLTASRCELWSWRESLEGRLAEIIVLDQFSRNIFRGTARAFSNDTLALALAQEALHDGRHLQLEPPQKAFLYMPFMHSESLMIHEKAVELYAQKGLELNLDFEMKHKTIIEKFGRYPHRNEILNRPSTEEEIEFLRLPDSSF